jgi:hypothetical protein
MIGGPTKIPAQPLRFTAPIARKNEDSAVKRIVLFACVFLLSAPRLVAGAVDIAPECRVANRPPGRCGWCAVETLARHHGIKALYGLVDKNSSQSRPADLEKVVAASQSRFRVQQRGAQGTEILDHAIRSRLGAVVGLRPSTGNAGGHIVTLVDFGPEEVRYIDPNYPDRVRMMDREGFMERWDGFALILDRP